ncbi:MAG: hypothetical protein JWQ11_2721 [Rhizobacter sp.]|nr:hypothetical protein [Rhizobacter sp.]
MSTLISTDSKHAWKRRLFLPAYAVKEAARYAKVTPQTLLNWQKASPASMAAVARRAKGDSLSYMQLVEVAFVASLRAAGVKLIDIRNARDYMSSKLKAEFPFAEHRFKTDGQDILMELPEFESGASKGKLVKVNRGGQLAWAEIVERKFEEFDYQKGLAIRWKVGGSESPIQIDPRVSFGAPAVAGIATWAIAGRAQCGESLDDIADDFSITVAEVEDALKFEGMSEAATLSGQQSWNH